MVTDLNGLVMVTVNGKRATPSVDKAPEVVWRSRDQNISETGHQRSAVHDGRVHGES